MHFIQVKSAKHVLQCGGLLPVGWSCSPVAPFQPERPAAAQAWSASQAQSSVQIHTDTAALLGYGHNADQTLGPARHPSAA